MSAISQELSPPLFERAALCGARLLIRWSLLLAIYQLRYAERPKRRALAALGSKSIGLLAGALGAVVQARSWVVSGSEISEYLERQIPAVELGTPDRLVRGALSESVVR